MEPGFFASHATDSNDRDEYPSEWIEEGEGESKVSLREPNTVSRVEEEVVLMSRRIDHWMFHLDICGIPRDSPLIDHAPDELDSFMRIEETGWPATDPLEERSFYCCCSLPE